MKIRFPKEIKLACVEILVVEYEGEECELDMNVDRMIRAGQEFDGVEFDQETPTDVRIWLNDLFVILKVPRDVFEIVEQ